MDYLIKTYKNKFHCDFPENLRPDGEVIPLYDDEKCLLFGSQSAAKNPIVFMGDVDRFQAESLENYYLVGFWGHGLNSHAFYYVRVDSWRKVYFRLPYGGGLMDNEKAAYDIMLFFIQYAYAESLLINSVKEFCFVLSMGSYHFQCLTNNGITVYLKEDLFRDPRFLSKIQRLTSLVD